MFLHYPAGIFDCTFCNPEGPVQPVNSPLLTTQLPSYSTFLLKSWRVSTACHLSFTNNSRVDSQKLPSYGLSLAREAEPHRNVSWPFTVHLAWCASSGCWFTLPYYTHSVSPPPFCYVGMCFWGPAPKWVSPTSIHSSNGLSTVH
jgi:hypothetical protein